MRQLNPHNVAVAQVFNLIESLGESVMQEMRGGQKRGALIPDEQIVYTEKVFKMILDFVDKKCFED